ncbi:MAG: hypothetical protein KDB22_27115 [Planctomycetales bacterium]|nr:hypothetical protein [Planctomycetales bacterium]
MAERIQTSLVAICLLLSAERAHSADMTECLRKARVLPAAIQTIDYQYGMDGVPNIKRFVIEGDHWYYGVANSKNELPTQEFAFDGNRYQQKIAGEFLSFSDANLLPLGQVEIHPILIPYTWFREDSKMLTLHDLHDQQRWSSVIERMTLEGTEDVDGRACEVYRIEYPNRKVTVSFSVADQGYPIRVRSEYSAGRTSELKVTELAAFPGPAIVGLRLLGSNTRVQQHFWIERDNLLVNKRVDQSIFSLDPTDVVEIIDIDEMKRTNERLRSDAVPAVIMQSLK